MLKVLKGYGVELTSYHGGSFTGKDILKIMNNAEFIFQTFANLSERKEGSLHIVK